MPSSHNLQLNEIVSIIMSCNPKSVLDVGAGFGKFGVLCREYLELWDGRFDYSTWLRRIDAIEIFPDYLTPLHEYVYNKVHVGNAADILEQLEDTYDLILLIDIIEHFSTDEGFRILELCKQKGKNILISTPRVVLPQKGVFNNPHETHVSQWAPGALAVCPNSISIANVKSVIVLTGPDAESVGKKIKDVCSVEFL